VALLENEPWSGERQQRLATLAAREPQNPFLHFALAWTARRGGDLATAEREYRRTLERWPEDDRVLTNLGNVLAMEGRQEDALQLYERAIHVRPANPAPHFNESQIYTQRFEYIAATEALSRASALDFDLVRDYQALGTNDGVLALVDQWVAPGNFWLALGQSAAPASVETSLPPPWRGHMETSGWRFSLAAAVVGFLAALLGSLGHRALPLRACSNCGRVVCRRCAQRRRETAECRACAALETRAQNPDFARVLLKRSARQAERLRHVTRTVVATLLPGFGLIAFRRALTPLVILAVAVLLVGPLAGVTLPFELEPHIGLADRLPSLPVRIGLGVVLYAVSIAGYFSCVARDRVRSARQAAAASDAAEPRPRRWRAQAA
jgi:tetratricopeptide (TPR) repeat protein